MCVSVSVVVWWWWCVGGSGGSRRLLAGGLCLQTAHASSALDAGSQAPSRTRRRLPGTKPDKPEHTNSRARHGSHPCMVALPSRAACKQCRRARGMAHTRKWRWPSSTGNGRPHVTSCSCASDRPTSSEIWVCGVCEREREGERYVCVCGFVCVCAREERWIRQEGWAGQHGARAGCSVCVLRIGVVAMRSRHLTHHHHQHFCHHTHPTATATASPTTPPPPP